MSSPCWGQHGGMVRWSRRYRSITGASPVRECRKTGRRTVSGTSWVGAERAVRLPPTGNPELPHPDHVTRRITRAYRVNGKVPSSVASRMTEIVCPFCASAGIVKVVPSEVGESMVTLPG